MINVYVFLAVLSASLTYALARGGAPERHVAVLVIAGTIISKAAMLARGNVFDQDEHMLLLIDSGMVVVASIVALRAHRIWPIWCAAALLAGVELQAGAMLAPLQHQQVYRVCHALSGYLVLALLIAGTWRHERRLRKFGVDPDWEHEAGSG